MACYHPLKGFKIGVNDSGKPNYMITSYDTEYIIKGVNNNWYPANRFIGSDVGLPKVREFIEIPCGKCVGCLLKRSREWADRCMMEASYHEHNSFITLTYNDAHLPDKPDYVDLDGVVHQGPYSSLCKKDFQDFMKRLREKIKPVKIRFFACGEYGDFNKTGRPHYHAIIFGYDFPDRKLLKQNFRGENYYISKILQDAWSIRGDPIGNVLVTDVSWDTCAYVARYCLKKRDNDLSLFYDYFNLDKEFNLMSRKPGIARQYYDDHRDHIYESERIILSDEKGSKKIRPPKYFDKLYDIDCPEDMAIKKEKRKEFLDYKKQLELSKTDLDYLDYLKVKEDNFHSRTKILNERSKVYEPLK